MHNLHTIEVQIHMTVNDGYRVKIAVIDLGFYLNGALVFPPNEQHDDWVVYPPVIKTRYKSIYPAEFNKKERLWQEMVQACIEAVQTDQAAQPNQSGTDFADGVDVTNMTNDEFDRMIEKGLDDVFPDRSR